MSADNKPPKSTVIDAKKAIFDKIFKENQELRDRNHELALTLTAFEKLAREREEQHKRFEDLEESIIKAGDLAGMTKELQKKLAADFAIPLSNLTLFESVKNTIELDLQETFEPADSNQESNPVPALTFINEDNYNHLFPRHRPLITAHPDPILLALLAPLTESETDRNIASSAFVPLVSRGRAIGTLNLASPDPEKFIPDAATDAVESLGRKLATVIENSLLMTQLQKLLRTDPLTGLYNRHTLDEVLPVEFTRAQRYGHPLSLVIIDLDNFKHINDHYGHPAGDKVLSETGALINNNLRQHDIGLRYGGDKFTIILPETNHQQGQAFISRLTKIGVAAKVKVDHDTQLPIRLSAGLATYPDNPVAEAESLKKAADDDLYRTKEKKKKKSKKTKTKEKK